MIDVRDIGAVVAKVLAAPAAHAGKTYTLTGAPITMSQVASAIGEVIGKPVKYAPVPVQGLVEMIAKMGAEDYQQVSMRDYFAAYARGWMSDPTTTVRDITGREPRTIADFARDFAGAFGKK